VNDVFDKVQEFIDAAKAGATDLVTRAADVVCEFEAWLRSIAAKHTFACPPAAKARAADLAADLDACPCPAPLAPAVGAKAATAGAPVGAVDWTRLAALVKLILSFFA
jgi:hypothetical protein